MTPLSSEEDRVDVIDVNCTDKKFVAFDFQQCSREDTRTEQRIRKNHGTNKQIESLHYSYASPSLSFRDSREKSEVNSGTKTNA